MVDIQYNKKNTMLVGAGGFGREIASWLSIDSQFLNEFKLTGFLDDNLIALEGYKSNLEIIDKITVDALNSSQNVILAVAGIAIRKKIVEDLIVKSKVELLSYKFHNVLVGSYTNIGKGVVLSPSVIVSCNVEIGDGVFINSGSQIGHDVQIGKYCSIMANVDLGGGVIIEDEVFIGSGAVILPGVRITKGTRIGAGSVVLRNIKKPGTYFGNPVKKIF